MATPRAAIGTLLKRNGTTVALVADIDGPGMKGDTVDVTNHDNADGYKEFIVSTKEGGDVKAKLYWDPLEEVHTDLISTFEDRSLDTWSIVPPVGTASWSFTGVITAFHTKWKATGAIEADLTIKVSGKPTFA
jgi:predicted secreted protein